MIGNLTTGTYMDEKLEQAVRNTEPSRWHFLQTLKSSPYSTEREALNTFPLILERLERKISLVSVCWSLFSTF